MRLLCCSTRADCGRTGFDIAMSTSPSALAALTAFADPTHITFGSGLPFAPPADFIKLLDESALGDATKTAINRGSAELLFPRLAGNAPAQA